MAALARRNEETVWVEPRFSHPVLEVGEVDQRLLRMIRKRRGVDAQPFLLVLSGYEGSDLDAGWDRRLRQRVIEVPPHDQQLPLPGHPGRSGQSLGCGSVTHGPDPQRASRFHDQPLQQLSADPRSPMVGRHDELTGAPLRAQLQLGVPHSSSCSLTRTCRVVGCVRRSRNSAASLRARIWSTASASATNRSTLSISVPLSSVATEMVNSLDTSPR